MLTVVTGGRPAGERLTTHPDIAKITLTGGTEAGRAAAVATASRFARVTAELGGKTPIVVFDDVDPIARSGGCGVRRFRCRRPILCRRFTIPRPPQDLRTVRRGPSPPGPKRSGWEIPPCPTLRWDR